MIRLGISVEGQTENEFVAKVLAPHLLAFDIDARSTIVETKRLRDGTRFVGGSISIDRVVKHIRPLLYGFDRVTTLYDFYGFRDRFSGENVDALEQRLEGAVGSPLFFPYVQRYEFESLLFGGNGVLPPSFESVAASSAIAAVVEQFGDPELINDGHDTAPSRRLGQLFLAHFHVNYDKTGFGPPWAASIGLERLRANCARFGRWLQKLEQLS
jgi:hypothetical protein